MILNAMCVRDLMLYFEEHTAIEIRTENGHNTAYFNVICPALLHDIEPLKKYELEEILYHVVQLTLSGYIVSDFTFNPERSDGYLPVSAVYYVTPKGHDFAASIRQEREWTKVSSILKTLGNVSLRIIEAVSKGVADAAIDAVTSGVSTGTLPIVNVSAE